MNDPSGKSHSGVSRRDLFRTSALAVSALAIGPHTAGAAEPAAKPPAPAKPAMEPLNRFGRMVQEHFVNRLREFEATRIATIDGLKSKSGARSYVKSVREKIRDCFGPFPEKTPLNPRVTGVLDRDTYRIEKVIFESRPGFFVTGNLYLPKGRIGPSPGVIGACGHSDVAKAYEAYQSFAQGLARMGYVVFIYDPISQGERIQYPGDGLKSKIGVGVREHLYEGNQQFLVGEFFGAWRAWDGIRALDYLLSRPEVDPNHVGVTGNSGGGTLTTWLCGLDPRFTMGAPSCFVTSFRRNLENELPADTEQCPPRVLALGLDHEDFIAAMAPKPVVLLAKEADFFDVRGTEEAFARLKKIYRLLGAEENISLFIGPGGHGYEKVSREAMYRCFNKATGISNAQTEPQLVLEKTENLWCTPNGRVCDLPSKPLREFTRDRSRELGAKRKRLDRSDLLRATKEILKLPARDGTPHVRILRSLHGRNHPLPNATVYAVETESDIQAVVYRLSKERHEARPPAGIARAILYVSHQSADAELRDEPLVKQLIAEEPDAAFYSCDVRGTGESQPDSCDAHSFFQPYGCDFFYAIHSIMLGGPYVGRRTHDVLSVLDWLRACGHTEIHLAARGWGTIPATFAALHADAIVRVTVKGALTSYSEIAESENYSWPLSSFVPSILEKFDLPDCYRALEAKGLRQIEPAGAVTAG